MATTQTLTSLLKDHETVQKQFILDEDERPKLAHNHFSDEIPVISLDGIDDDHHRREIICKRIAEACEEWGLFQVVDHGIDIKLVNDMINLSNQFFDLPDEEKLRFDMSGGKNGGYLISSHIQNEAVANWREMMVFIPYPLKERDYTRWPDKPKEWRAVTEAYSEKLMGLSCKLLEVLSEAMGLERDSIRKACKEMAQRLLVNYYPRCPQPDLAIGVKRHTDPGTITLLLQDQVGGLQVTKDGGENWITVQPIEGAFVVNLGDHSYYLSNGRFKNADHQAVVNHESSRLSIAAFINPEQESIVYPLKVEEGDKPILENPSTFADMYKTRMSFHLERKKLKKLAKEQKLQKEDLEKFIQNSGENVKTLEELLV